MLLLNVHGRHGLSWFKVPSTLLPALFLSVESHERFLFDQPVLCSVAWFPFESVGLSLLDLTRLMTCCVVAGQMGSSAGAGRTIPGDGKGISCTGSQQSSHSLGCGRR